MNSTQIQYSCTEFHGTGSFRELHTFLGHYSFVANTLINTARSGSMGGGVIPVFPFVKHQNNDNGFCCL